MSNCKNLLIQLLLLRRWSNTNLSSVPPLFKKNHLVAILNFAGHNFHFEMIQIPPFKINWRKSTFCWSPQCFCCSSEVFFSFEWELISSVSHDGFVLFAVCVPGGWRSSVAPPPGLEPPGSSSSSRMSCEKLIEWDYFWMQFYSFII